MGKDADQLKRDIERTRGDLTGTVDAIGDRVSPGRIVERRANRVRLGARSVRDRVMGSASDAAGTVGDTASGTATSVKDTVSSAATAVKEAPSTVKAVATEKTEGAPLAVGIIAFGAGLVAAALVKPTEKESRIAQAAMDAAQPVKESLTEAGKELAGGLKDQGRQAVEEVKSTATSGAQDVKETARQASEQTAEMGRQAVTEVKDQVKGQGGPPSSTSAPPRP